MTILFAWLGNTDLRASIDNEKKGIGPIFSGLESLMPSRLVLLSDHSQKDSEHYAAWLRNYWNGEIQVNPAKLTSPTSFEEIYLATDSLLKYYRQEWPQVKFVFHLSPGTPAMAAVWILHAKTSFPAELIESSREQGVKVVSIPFDLSLDYLPGRAKSVDDALARLVQGLPPESPEFDAIVHRCDAMQRVVAMARRLAFRDVPVLIQGESGTGKELFARAIHQASARHAKPLVAINCGAIPHELVDAELFGYEKGAFTGATSTRMGFFQTAHGGTLFLDEIGELPLQSQVRLLRVLQEGEVTPVGANQSVKIDVRIIAATNRILPAEVRAGRFREDLFHRLAVGVLLLPPLRERSGDVSLLLDTLMDKINSEAAGQPGYDSKIVSVDARNIIIKHSWPGNIRELYNTMLRASIWASGSTINGDDVREALAVSVPPPIDSLLHQPLLEGFNLNDLMSNVAINYLERAMIEAHGNKTEAARLLGLSSYQTLTNWLEKYGVNK